MAALGNLICGSVKDVICASCLWDITSRDDYSNLETPEGMPISIIAETLAKRGFLQEDQIGQIRSLLTETECEQVLSSKGRTKNKNASIIEMLAMEGGRPKTL
jgi:hypothetical protein